MTAPYVTRLRTDISACADPTRRAMLTAELGCYWARVGEYKDAERIRSELREHYGDGRSVRVTIMLMCLEGILQYFTNLGFAAIDRLARAKLLSVAAKDSQLTALTSAWLAHFQFNANMFDQMSKSIETCFESLTIDNDTAYSRISLLMADALTYSGNATRAQVWYDRARGSAQKMGDHAAIGALTYNRAAMRVFHARASLITAAVPVTSVSVGMLKAEVSSATNYQHLVELRSLAFLLDSAKVGVLLLDNDYRPAIVLIGELLASADVDPESGLAMTLKADLALCFAGIGDQSKASGLIHEFSTVCLSSHHSDDIILALDSIIRAAALCSLVDAMAQYEKHLEVNVRLYVAESDKLLTRIDALDKRYSAISDASNL